MSTGKGKKRVRNQPAIHDEMKKMRGVWLTNSSWDFVREQAVRHGVSASEFMEELLQCLKRETTG